MHVYVGVYGCVWGGFVCKPCHNLGKFLILYKVLDPKICK